MTNWWAALNFILIDLAENQSYCLYNYRGSAKISVQFRTLYMIYYCTCTLIGKLIVAVKRCGRFTITGKSVLYFKSIRKVKSK